MKKLILLFLLVPALAFANDISTIAGKAISAVSTIAGKAKADIATVGGGGVPEAGDTYSDVIFFWRCEGTTLGAGDCYGTDNVASGSSAVAINTDAAYSGTNGIDVPGSADYYTLDNNSEYVLSEGRVGFWLRIATWEQYAGIFLAEGAGGEDNRILLIMFGTDELLLNWHGNADSDDLQTSNANLSTATWYFIEFAWKQSTNYMEIFVDGVSKGSSSASLTAWAEAMSVVRFGEVQGYASDYHMDLVMISTSSTRNLYLLRALTSCPR